MILTGPQIESAVERGDIVIRPFRRHQLTPNSFDFRLGGRCCVYTKRVLDSAKENESRTFSIPAKGLILRPDRIYLVNTEEIMGSRRYVPIIRGRSSAGRLGIFINITADLIDIGSVNQWTLQLHAVQPVRIHRGMLIGQVTFWKTFGRRIHYKGKYLGRQSPVPSLSFLDSVVPHA
jgi:dCTP deaminase